MNITTWVLWVSFLFPGAPTEVTIGEEYLTFEDCVSALFEVIDQENPIVVMIECQIKDNQVSF